ncbi:MAG: ferrochelatase [Eggerthellaceae bacterium]
MPSADGEHCPGTIDGPSSTNIERPGYIEALAKSVLRSWLPRALASSKLVVSFHSVPVSFAKRGDTYVEATRKTAQRLAKVLGMDDEGVLVTYQSRFDNRKWQGPMLVPELERLAREGVDDVAVVCPGFAVDCIETSSAGRRR